jgi:peptide methionine sulfoxide reductase msrA/msrB
MQNLHLIVELGRRIGIAAVVGLLAFAASGCADEAARPTSDPQVLKETSMTPSAHTPGSGRKVSAAGYDVTPLDRATVKELASKLDPEAYRVTQNAGTEPAFCGTLLDNKREGTYVCVVCGLPLFSSDSKFNSGTGWPSFYQPVDKDHIAYHEDASHGMVRTEIECARCSGHLGHVFEDGPKPTGLRYCLNGAALTFYDKGALPKDRLTPGAAARLETAYFAGGCFWGIEHWFSLCPGVVEAVSGYMGGTGPGNYEAVCSGTTGHAEVVKVVFDPSKVTYRQLLEGFFMMHDPTQVNRQGPDVGTQYRSAIFCSTPEQLSEARSEIARQQDKGLLGRRIATEVAEAGTFHTAEAYHQDYVDRTGRACHGINPWPKVLGEAAAGTGSSAGHP